METRRRIAVAGATGRLGRHVVDVLETSGHRCWSGRLLTDG
jgi:nucleoside-diphosphate-sugar epimerase